MHLFSLRNSLLVLLAPGVIFLAACSKGPAVNVDGDRLTEADLRKHRPKVYWELRKEYDQKLSQALNELAYDRMVELEAKEKGLSSGKDYIAAIRAQAAPPSEQQVREVYGQLQAAGQTGGRSFDDARPRIVQMMQGQAGNQLVQAELARLQEKYRYANHPASYPPESETPVEIAIHPEDPSRLNPQAKVTIVEFSDFECPFCARAQETTRRVRETYGDRIRWVMKDFPLDFHENAMGAHIAAHCVWRQDPNKYWAFFDTIFAPDRPNDILLPGRLRNVAAQHGVNMDAYDVCLNDPAVKTRINENMRQGQEAGVSGTPSFFVNGHQIEGARPFDDFKALIDRELERAGS